MNWISSLYNWKQQIKDELNHTPRENIYGVKNITKATKIISASSDIIIHGALGGGAGLGVGGAATLTALTTGNPAISGVPFLTIGAGVGVYKAVRDIKEIKDRNQNLNGLIEKIDNIESSPKEDKQVSL
jgi:hypothetical protein